MKATKRIASLLLCGAMTLSLFPTPALAEVFAAADERVGDARATVGAFEVSGDSAGCSYANGVLTVNDGADITISMASGATAPTSDRIVVNGNANITLNGVNITPVDAVTNDGYSGIDLASGVTLNITLQSGSSNVIKGGTSTTGLPGPGIHVPEGSTLTIKGEGSLTVEGASGDYAAAVGIGGMGSSSGAGEACGNVIILGGTITVHGGTSKTGNAPVDIGGGASDNGNGGNCSTVIILTSVNSNGNLEIGGGSGAAVGGGKGSDGSGIKPTNDGNYTVYGDLELPFDITIPAGTTVVIPEGTSLTVPEGMTLTNNGTILVQGGTFTNNGTVNGNQPAYPSTVTVSFSQNGKSVTSVPYGSTVTITATMEKAETAANALSADTGKVVFYLGDANDTTGIRMDTGTVTFVDGAYTASVDVTIGQDKGFDGPGAYKFTADFGGYAPEGNESGDSLAPNTGSANLTVVESYIIDYEEETITIADGFSLYEAETSGEAILTSSGENKTASLTNYIQNNERNLYLQAPAAEGETAPDRREITIPARPVAPVAPTINYSEEKLSFTPDVTETTLEYALSQSDQNWQDVPSGAALSDMGWNGTAEKTYYFRKGATATSFASSPTTTSVTAPPRPEAPEGLLLQDWTDVSLSFYVGKGVQCRLGNEGVWVTLGQNETDHTFIDLTPQTTYTIYARYPATESQFASAEASIEGTTKSSAADAPEVGAATVTDTTVTLPYDTAWEYKMGDGDWQSIQNPNVFTSLTAATQYTYHVRVKETETAEASEIATVTVWTAHAKPTGVQGGPNKITGVTTDMEYKLSTAEAWTECGGTEVTDLAAGNYQVRHNADVGGAPASEAVTVTVDKGEQDKPEGEISLISSTENSLSVNFFSYMSENNAGVEISYAKGLTANTPTSE